jgi:mRNA interferase MazF
MKKYQRGQLWLVNFDPSIGHEYKKLRPALIIQYERYISSSGLLTVIPISSQITKPTELDVILEKDARNRLMKTSLLREFTKNSTPILPVFLPVFCVAIMKEYT